MSIWSRTEMILGSKSFSPFLMVSGWHNRTDSVDQLDCLIASEKVTHLFLQKGKFKTWEHVVFCWVKLERAGF